MNVPIPSVASILELVKKGYTPFIPPLLVHYDAMMGTSYFPGGEEQAYAVGVQVSQTHPSLMELELLNRKLIGEGKGPKVESDSESRISRR